VKDNREWTMWNAARRRATGAGVPFTITIQDITIPKKCPILGIPLDHSQRSDRTAAPSLDRIVPQLGYVRGNVHVVSDRANTLKRDATLNELVLLGRYAEVTLKSNARNC
jgi:hypothetical protein